MHFDSATSQHVITGGAAAVGTAALGPLGFKAGSILGSILSGAISGGVRSGINTLIGKEENLGIGIASGAAGGLVSGGAIKLGIASANPWGIASGFVGGIAGKGATIAAISGGDPGQGALIALMNWTMTTGVFVIAKAPNLFNNSLDLGSNLTFQGAENIRQEDVEFFAPGGGVIATVVRGVSGRLTLNAVLDILRPGGSLIGNKGNQNHVRLISGGASQLKSLFDRLTVGGNVLFRDAQRIKVGLPEVGEVQFRTFSRTGGPVIEVKIKGLGIEKIHVK